jgi:hypothetical protein
MKKLLTCATGGSCFLGLVSLAQAHSAYDGSWDVVFVTQRAACDATYNFSVNIKFASGSGTLSSNSGLGS